MKDFAERLRTLREERQLSQHELAELVGVHFGQISRYERGAILPSVETVALLAQALRVSADALLFETARGSRAKVERREIGNLVLLQRFRSLEQMERGYQQTAIELIDALIAKQRMKSVVSGKAPA